MQVAQVALLLLVSLLGVKLNQAGCLSGFKDYYDQINSYLTTAVGSDDVEKNMVRAAEWLAELEQKGGSSSRDLVKALKTLLQLKTVVGEDKCNWEAYEILSKNDEKSGHAATGRAKDNSLRRIDLIVKFYAKKHSDVCYEVWPQKLATKLQDVSTESMKYVEKFAKERIFPWVFTFEQTRYIQLLRSHLEADPDHQKKVADKKYNYQKNSVSPDDYRKYLLHPCKEVEQKVSNALYKPIKFDIDLHSRGSKWWTDDNKEFRYQIGIMDWCDHILTHEGQIWDEINATMRNEKKWERKS